MSVLLPADHLSVETVEVEHKRITVTAASTTHATPCPVCETLSRRVHSRYMRTIADLPIVGRAFVLMLRVRRFFCDAPNCPRKIFAERFGPDLPAFARRTIRLASRLLEIAYAAGGHGGARLARALDMPASVRTLLRLLHAEPTPRFPAPSIVGLDDWRGRRGGTMARCVLTSNATSPSISYPIGYPTVSQPGSKLIRPLL